MKVLTLFLGLLLGVLLMLMVNPIQASDPSAGAVGVVNFGLNDIEGIVNYTGIRYSDLQAGAPGLIGYRYRGSPGLPQAVKKDDVAFRMRAYGYDGTQLQMVGELGFEIDGPHAIGERVSSATNIEPVGIGNMPGRFVVRMTGTDPNILVEAMRIDQNTHAPAPGGFDVYFGRDIVGERYTDLPTSAPHFVEYRYRGTKEAPQAVQNGDHLGTYRTYGYDGAKLVEAADITVEVDGVPSLDDMPARIVFWVTPDGKAYFEKAVAINSDKSVTIPELASSSGLRFVCVNTAGKLVSQATACSGQ